MDHTPLKNNQHEWIIHSYLTISEGLSNQALYLSHRIMKLKHYQRSKLLTSYKAFTLIKADSLENRVK